ncbi:MAG: NADPH-dependent FMN reductase [Woeseiaceae bacterium]
MTLNTAVIYGSVRRERQGIKLARFIERRLNERGHKVTLVDPQEYPLPLLDLRFSEYAEGTAPDAMQKVADILEAADGFIIVSGEYNGGMPPALKNLLDHYLPQYRRKPSGIASYSAGSFAGTKVQISLRLTLSQLGASPIPATLVVPGVQKAFDDKGNALDDAYEGRADKFLEEYEWYARALKTARE